MHVCSQSYPLRSALLNLPTHAAAVVVIITRPDRECNRVSIRMKRMQLCLLCCEKLLSSLLHLRECLLYSTLNFKLHNVWHWLCFFLLLFTRSLRNKNRWTFLSLSLSLQLSSFRLSHTHSFYHFRITSVRSFTFSHSPYIKSRPLSIKPINRLQSCRDVLLLPCCPINKWP